MCFYSYINVKGVILYVIYVWQGQGVIKILGYYAWFTSAHNLLFIHLILRGGLNIWPETGEKLTGLYFIFMACPVLACIFKTVFLPSRAPCGSD